MLRSQRKEDEREGNKGLNFAIFSLHAIWHVLSAEGQGKNVLEFAFIPSIFFSQVQLRLQQVVSAPSDKKEDLLKELEQFAFRGIPNVSSPRIPDAATAKPAFGEAENCDGEREPVRGETAAETEEVRCRLNKTRDKTFVLYQKGFSHSANKEKK